MLPCLRITLSSNLNPRPQQLSTTRKALTVLHAVRRSSTTVAPPLDQQETYGNDAPAVDNSGMEFLCTLGIDTASALELLKKVPILPNASQLEALSFVLVSIANVPAGKLAELFVNADPEFFTLPPETISANYKAICGAWPTEKQLCRSIISYPAILKSSFPGELRRCMTSLRGIGFSTSQTAAAVVRCPELTKLRRYEITSALAQCGINGKIEDTELFEMLSKNPNFLTPDGSKNLSLILEAVKKATGLTAQQAQHIVARCPSNIFQQKTKHIRQIAELLLDFGLTQAQIGQAALLYPSLVCRPKDRIQQTLQILSSYKVTPTQVATYPQVFIHNPERILAPRLVFLKKHAPEKISTLSLATLFSSTDETFSSTFSKSASKTYLKYKLKSLVQYQLGNALETAAMLDDEEEQEQEGKLEKVDSDVDEDSEIVVSKSADAKRKIDSPVAQISNQQKESKSLASDSKEASVQESQKKQESTLIGEENITNNEKRKQQQQHQQQRRRFFRRTNSASKPKNTNQQQQLKRLTPGQLEKSKERKLTDNRQRKFPSPPTQQQSPK